jgi:hypothetical protein
MPAIAVPIRSYAIAATPIPVVTNLAGVVVAAAETPVARIIATDASGKPGREKCDGQQRR